jgi:beta-xylosidase
MMNSVTTIKTAVLLITFLSTISAHAQVRNFSPTGEQVTKFDNTGRAVDAHDGMIASFDGTYYLYGTSYDCGFEWNNKTAPFCGFKSYSSKDLIHWKDEGFLFDAQNQLWQSRCDGKTYGCFRPHVAYNRKNKQYVLWINVYDNVVGYRVFTSRSPAGPFTEVEEPKIAINNDKPAAGLNNGDHDLFVDDDGTAYLAMTDWRAKGAIAIEQLTDDYLSGTGKVVTQVTSEKTEAPGLFKRKGIYYVTYSDPNCGYCSGTGTSYKTASSPLGPWSAAKKISDNSCGGQPSFVATLRLPKDTLWKRPLEQRRQKRSPGQFLLGSPGLRARWKHQAVGLRSNVSAK